MVLWNMHWLKSIPSCTYISSWIINYSMIINKTMDECDDKKKKIKRSFFPDKDLLYLVFRRQY